MQVVTLFRETAKLLGASMEGSVMDNSKYCMKPEAPADDGYETCLDAMCGPHQDRFVGGSHHFDPVGDDMRMRHPPPPPPPLNSHPHPHPPPPHPNSMKMEQYGGDPYSFVDEMPNMDFMCNNNSINGGNPVNPSTQPKKRGRRKKSDPRNAEFNEQHMIKSVDEKLDAKERKRQDRFNGLTEEEVALRTLPDHLAPNLDIIIVGINPGMFAAYKGHHYAGPGNHFWKCLYLSGLVPEPFTAEDDFSLLNYGLGFTNMVARPTKGSADLTRREIKQGSQILLEKLQKFRPKIAVFNGKLIYEVFSGKKDFPFGRQSEFVEGTNTYIWVMPSSSARCAQLPRAADKVPFYMALKKFRDYLSGLISEIDESEVVFHEPKSSTKSNANSPNSIEAKHSSSKYESTANGESLSFNPAKKKRGRPRKGMEKNNDMKSAKVLKPSGNNKEEAKSVGPDEPQRKRRGRPKKIKPEDGGPTTTPAKSSNSAIPRPGTEGYERGMQSAASILSSQQKASSVSSGYSTGTAGSNSSEDRCRRDENGSLSNGGSNNLSPSHHSFTTQSDLSSEISAAISCGSCPPSPLNNTTTNNNSNNNQTETVFDGLSTMSTGPARNQTIDLNHHNNKHTVINAMHGNEPPPNNCNNMYQQQSSGGMESHQSHDQSSYSIPHPQYQPSYDNRFHHVSNRSQSYTPASREEEQQQAMQTPPSYQQQQIQQQLQQSPSQQQPHQRQPQQSSSTGSYEQKSYEQKCLDITTKSLSGLESLVDQIPSIAEAEANVSGGHIVSDQSQITHSQAMASISNIPSSMSHGGHFGESSTGFLPYGHHVPPSTYAAASHYASSPYYASDLSSSFPVNTLSSAYPPSPSLFGYAGYHHSQYQGGGFGAPTTSSLHLPPSAYGSPGSYSSSAYSNPNPYMQGHSMSMSSTSSPGMGQRYPQRPFHLRQEDLGPLGFGGF